MKEIAESDQFETVVITEYPNGYCMGLEHNETGYARVICLSHGEFDLLKKIINKWDEE